MATLTTHSGIIFNTHVAAIPINVIDLQFEFLRFKRANDKASMTLYIKCSVCMNRHFLHVAKSVRRDKGTNYFFRQRKINVKECFYMSKAISWRQRCVVW